VAAHAATVPLEPRVGTTHVVPGRGGQQHGGTDVRQIKTAEEKSPTSACFTFGFGCAANSSRIKRRSGQRERHGGQAEIRPARLVQPAGTAWRVTANRR
jgi:hypothetical protein